MDEKKSPGSIFAKSLPARVEISDEELASLTNAIKTRFGIDFTRYESKSLKRGFARLIARHDLESLVGLWSKILKDREFLLKYIDELLVNLTEVFRNPEVWLKLRDDLPSLFKDKPVINFWHAGCSTGEEIYSMAILLKEIGLLHKVKTLATDLSNTALDQAKSGAYNQLLWKKYSAAYSTCFPKGKLSNHFLCAENGFTIKNELKSHITFQRHNLVQDEMRKKFDIILCRNVMIYFDDKLKMKVLKLFYDSLVDDGYFIIGYYDMLPEQSRSLFVLMDAKTRIYRKAA